MYDKNPPPPRLAGPGDFKVDVDGLGEFVFGRRKMGDQFAIEVEFARLTQGVQPTEWLKLVGEWMSSLRILMVKAPTGFDLDELDPLDDDVYNTIGKVFRALRAREESFRQKPPAGGQAGRPDPVPAGDLLVSPQVPAVAPGPEVP